MMSKESACGLFFVVIDLLVSNSNEGKIKKINEKNNLNLSCIGY